MKSIILLAELLIQLSFVGEHKQLIYAFAYESSRQSMFMDSFK